MALGPEMWSGVTKHGRGSQNVVWDNKSWSGITKHGLGSRNEAYVITAMGLNVTEGRLTKKRTFWPEGSARGGVAIRGGVNP